ncbi:Multicopper oxidase [Ceratobasidium sp. AG-Ba]|nr:Multicopper oxidase [Ceratobasidium sp. AG-Ba]
MAARSTLLLSLLAASARVANAADVSRTLNIMNMYAAPDGYNRSVSYVNGQFPGTVIFANKGDVIRNTVVNQLNDSTMRRSVSIHWHGLFQSTTAYEDGPAFVTQCPIAPGHSYEYVIPTRDQAGTHWYHAHLGSQYVDGVRSIIVVYDPDDPHKALYDVDDATTIIQLSDWYHQPTSVLMNNYLSTGAEPGPDSGLINGRGRYKGGPNMDGHPLKIIEADGVAHQPYTVNSLDIHPGERYSIVVEANKAVGNYWIRAPITAKNTPNTMDPSLVKAILRYQGAPASEPTTSQTSGTKLDPSALKPLIAPGAPGGSAPADINIDLAFGGGGKAIWQVNNSQYKPPKMPTLLKIMGGNDTFEKSENTIKLAPNKTVQVVIHGSSGGFQHPWHLHGHTFDIIQNNGAVNYVNPPRRDVIPVGGIQRAEIPFTY